MISKSDVKTFALKKPETNRVNCPSCGHEMFLDLRFKAAYHCKNCLLLVAACDVEKEISMRKYLVTVLAIEHGL